MTKPRWMFFFALSLGIHALLWLAYEEYRQAQIQVTSRVPLYTSRIITQAELDALLRSRRIVVDSDAPESTTKPDSSAPYLSDRTRRVEKETIARGNGDGGGAARLGQSRKLQLKPNIDLPGYRPDPNLTMGSGELYLGVQPGVGGAIGSHDLVKSEVVQGAETLLNTDEYRFASFFRRVKQEIVPRWKPRVRQITRSQRRQLPEGVYLTDVTISADRDGAVTMVEVTRSSGFAAFDKAAVDAFWGMARFRNLPSELINQDGRYVTSFAFSVQVTKQGLWFDTADQNEEKRWAQDDSQNR
jgi:TonB family protein